MFRRLAYLLTNVNCILEYYAVLPIPMGSKCACSSVKADKEFAARRRRRRASVILPFSISTSACLMLSRTVFAQIPYRLTVAVPSLSWLIAARRSLPESGSSPPLHERNRRLDGFVPCLIHVQFNHILKLIEAELMRHHTVQVDLLFLG